MDLATATATELIRAIRERRLASRELLDDLLTRAEERNPELNAIVAWDVDRARAAAKAADDAAVRDEFAGPLHGLPMTVKDVFETEGLVTTSGARELSGHVPGTDAVAVARLKAAGAIVFGKTNTPLYAGDWQTYNDVYGRTNNPWDLSRTAGGSSGGAAAAVAAGLTPLELGSDIGGSIRIPAHFNGVFGLKPSWGIVPLRGHIPGPPGTLAQPDVGVAGPIGRGIADLRLSLDITAGPLPQEAAGWRLALDPGPHIDDIRGLRIATAFGEGGDVTPVAADVRAILDGIAAAAAEAGARVAPAPLPVPIGEGLTTWRDLVMPIIATDLPDHVFAQLASLDDVTARAMTSRFRYWMHASDRREHQRAAWAAFFEQHDVLLAPVMPTTAFPHDTDRPLAERTVDVDGTSVPHNMAAAWCCAIGSALLPVVTLPAGFTPSGLPAGVQVVGPFLSDLRLLRIAEVIADAAGVRFTVAPCGSPASA
ncbi:MAG TPA: amidase family protein [Streptosporangiaceae bacterium]|nr:amidase family protein [Streptosporangiaceae bacterium]